MTNIHVECNASCDKMASSTITTSLNYAKRSGTTGILGQLYETKLLSLIYFRAINYDKIVEFYLATNVNKVGSFDDICLRAKDQDEPFAVFIQVKHRENNKVLSLNEKDMVGYFKSYLQIRRKFKPNNQDVMFEGVYRKTRCYFVIYTNAKLDKNSQIDRFEFETLNHLLGTTNENKNVLQLKGTYYSKKFDLSKSVLEEHATALAQTMVEHIYGKFNYSQSLMQNDLVKRYHVVLAQHVFDISEEILRNCRTASFRQDFFNINEELLQVFKDELCTEILKRRKKSHKKFNFSSSFMRLCKITDVEEIYKEIGSFMIYRKGKFEFLDRIQPACAAVPFLSKINESEDTIREILELAIKESLPTLTFKVPASFGNKDLTITGNQQEVERKLNVLTTNIVSLLDKAKPNNRVIIDETIDEKILLLNGGIASAVGNLLVSDDEGNLQFSNDYESLGELARRLLDKLESKVDNLGEYTFKNTIEIFPTLSFELNFSNVNSLEHEFFKSLVFYTSQCNEEDVGKTLKTEIYQSLSDVTQKSIITSNAIFLKYHDEVQKWWMTPKVGSYLTKEGSLYQLAVEHSSRQSLISLMNMMHRKKCTNYTFNEEAANSIKLDEWASGTVIVTDNISLTAAKFTHHLDNTDCVLLDLEYILNLSEDHEKTLRSELLHAEKVIVIFEEASASSNKNVENIANLIQDKKVVVIIDHKNIENTKKYFPKIVNIMKDKRNKLTYLTKMSQKSILQSTKLTFQSDEVSFDEILDEACYGYVGGDVLNKIMHSNHTKIILGNPISNSNDICKSRYVPRTVISRTVETVHPANIRRTEGSIGEKPSKLYNTAEHVVIVGDPGMGKSTLLTQLSLDIKEQDPTVWILRINLLEHSRQFYKWQEDKTAIDSLESIKFFCKVAFSENRSKKDDIQITLEESNGTVYLKNCTGDGWSVFELKLFLHYYNTKTIIFLFDGFDEICPIYAKEVLTLIKVVENSRRKHKMLITSRSYDKIITILELKFGTLYNIKPFTKEEQRRYLNTFWSKIPNLYSHHNENLFQNICDFSMFMSKSEVLNNYMEKKDLQQVQSKIKAVVPFLTVSLNLARYFKNTLTCLDLRYSSRQLALLSQYPNIRDTAEKALFALESVCVKYDSFLKNDNEDTNEFIATPLHLQMTAEYLCNRITKTNTTPNNWNLDTNIFEIYESFLETKLKKIHFQEKNENDTTKPENIKRYKEMYADTIEKHKKLAAYTVYGKSLLDERELKRCEELINELKEGEEKSGIICSIVNDTPVFVHSTFAEYFAVEHVCDLLKSQRDPKAIWDFILNELILKANINVLYLLDAKVRTEEELTILVEQHQHVIFELLLKQSTHNEHGDIKSSLCEAIRYDLRNLGSLLTSTIENSLEETHLMDLIKIVKETNMLVVAVKMELESVVVPIVDTLRIIDESKLRVLFENIESLELNRSIERVSTDELLHRLHRQVWTRMDIVPEWENLSEFCGRIYFI